MPRMNHSGPEGKGPRTGRKLGGCKLSQNEETQKGELGKGMGKRRNAGAFRKEISQNKN